MTDSVEIIPLPLGDIPNLVGEECVVAGYGQNFVDKSTSRRLVFVNVKIIPSEKVRIFCMNFKSGES